jgi:NOL1/NOP2/fmu family ribosome biogenesis protein
LPDSGKRARTYFAETFGVEESFWEPYGFHERGGDIWLVSGEMDVEDDSMAAGIRLLRDTGIGLKPTTYGLQLLGGAITERRVELSREDLEELVFERERLGCGLSNGYVTLVFDDTVIGCGLVTGKGLETQVPKGRAQDLESML